MPVKRQLRKFKRQAKKGVLLRPVRFTRWDWWDWFAFILACCFAIWGFVSIGWHSERIHNNYHRSTSTTDLKHKHNISTEDEINLHVQPGKQICIGFIIAAILLILGMLLVFVWLRYFRNMLFFVLTFCAIVLLFFIYLILGISAAAQHANDESYINDVYNAVTDHLHKDKHPDARSYYLKLNTLQERYNCCGVVDHLDWKLWNGVITDMVASNDSVPNTCCIEKNEAMDYSCKNRDILKESPESEKYNFINKNKGCGKVLKDKLNGLFMAFWIEAFIIAFLLLLFLLLLLWLAHNLFKKSPRPNWELEYDPREQENDLESDIIPGGLGGGGGEPKSKSMLSSTYTTFYAP